MTPFGPADSRSVADWTMEGPVSGEPNGSIATNFVPDTYGIALLRFEEEGGRDVDWDAIHGAVQGDLGSLTDRVCSECPGAAWKAGRTSSRASQLFSYRVFYHLDGDDYDPVVVGVSLARRGPDVRIVGDISGDESGYVYFEAEPELLVPAEHAIVREGASRVAKLLASRPDVVIRAVRDRIPETGPR